MKLNKEELSIVQRALIGFYGNTANYYSLTGDTKSLELQDKISKLLARVGEENKDNGK